MKELYPGNFHHIQHHTKRNSEFPTISAEVSLFELLHYGTNVTIPEADSHQGN
jgi:hypothetical protein